MTPPQLKQNQRDAHSKYYTMYFTRCFKTMVQLLSSLLPEEAVLMRTDWKASFVTVKKESRSKTIRSHRVCRNQNTGQTDILGLPCVRKYPQIHHAIHFLSSTFHCCEGQTFSCTQDDQVSAQCIQSAPKLEMKHVQIWHSENRESWYTLIIKPTKCTNFSNLF